MNQAEQRARMLVDQVMKTWSPPILQKDARQCDIAQTAIMQGIWFVFGDDVFPVLTDSQAAAIEGGRKLYGQFECDEWNRTNPIGTPVFLLPYKGCRDDQKTASKTTSMAWCLESGHVVVKVEGRHGGWSLDCVEPVE